MSFNVNNHPTDVIANKSFYKDNYQGKYFVNNNHKINHAYSGNYIEFGTNIFLDNSNCIKNSKQFNIIITLLKYLLILNILYPTLSNYSLILSTSYINQDQKNYFPLINTKYIGMPSDIYLNNIQLISENANYDNDYLNIFVNDSYIKIKLIWDKMKTIDNTEIPNDDLISIENIELNENLFINGQEMFKDCSIIESINFHDFNTKKIINASYMFASCISLTNIFNFFPINAQDLSFLYYNCINLKNVNLWNKDDLILKLEVKTMESMFEGYSSLISFNLTNINFTEISTISKLFYGCKSLKYLNINNFIIDKITNMDSLFYECNSLEYLDLSHLNTNYLENINKMFYRCSSLYYLNLNGFNTELITDMSYLFYECTSLKILELGMLNTANVEYFEYMFYKCESLTDLNLSIFDTSKALSMEKMFCGCINLQSIQINNFDTKKVQNMEGMFQNCSKISSLDLSILMLKKFLIWIICSKDVLL